MFRRLDLVNKNIILRLYNTDGKLKSANTIRKEFLDYFLKDHSFVRSSSILNINDPSTPFVNAGMNQFKGVFLGLYDPPFSRIANSQKCIRIGGKHNDLDEVGLDTYHHTFFEMLGNWSFGDYSKEEACKYAWNLLTQVYGINKDLLYVTYFAGDEKLGLKPDLECKDIWLCLGVPENRILKLGAKENFWEMSSTGPCGVCTEIHISEAVNKPVNLMELWNIVFIQYERLNDGQIISLPKQHVDTGMGFERLVAILQEKKSNYDTDLFVPLFKTIEKFAKAPAYNGNEGIKNKNKLDTSYRILADHARMVTVALADGALPDNNPKLRKVLRKALDISNEIFKKDTLLHELTFHVADSLGEAYPELHKNIKQMQHIIAYEADSYYSLRNISFVKWKKIVKTHQKLSVLTDYLTPGLIAGYKDLKNFLASDNKISTLTGEFAFRLYDSHGLNVKTIAKLAEVESLKFDVNDFEEQLNKVKARSKAKTEGIMNMKSITELSIDLLRKLNIPITDDSLKYNYKLNEKEYSFPSIRSKLLGLIINGNLKTSSEMNDCLLKKEELTESEVYIILDKTPFYVNEGGQAFDKGFIQINSLLFDIYEVRKICGFIFHIGHLINNDSRRISLNESDLNIKNEEVCQVWINSRRRLGIMRNHTATHLLNAALRKVLPIIEQRGSYVEKDKLSFECSVFGQKLTNERVTEIEDLINKCIESNVIVEKKIFNMSEMIMEDDLRLLPGEMYPMTGIKITTIDSPDLKSKEACCGTHVLRTSSLEHFCILNVKSHGQKSVTIEAATGPYMRHIRSLGERLRENIIKLQKEFVRKNANMNQITDSINCLQRNLLERRDKRIISFVDYRECQDKLSELARKVMIRIKGNYRNYLANEIKKAQKSTNLPFVILHLKLDEYDFNELPLSKLDKMTNIPVLVILSTNTQVTARCMVPKEINSELFNAKIWMEPILKLFDGQQYFPTHKNKNLIFGMPPQNMSQRKSEPIIEKALDEVNKIASYFLNNQDKKEENKAKK